MGDLGRNRFPRSVRIRSKPDFDRLFREGVRASDNLLMVLGCRSEHGVARLGISTPRRFGNAVQRNRIKRLIREAFRTLPHPLPPGTDWIVLPRSAGRRASLESVRASLQQLAGKVSRRLPPENG